MPTATFGERLLRFYAGLRSPALPAGVEAMNPYRDRRVRPLVRAFLERYYGDNRPRLLLIGINPGRFGAGITGISFTDPVALADFCGIPNHLPRRRELSSIFVYDVIASTRGPAAFYRDVFVTAACPLGFTRGGTNLNYYDERPLLKAVTPFMVSTLRAQIALGARTDRAIVLGLGKNFEALRRLNDEHGFFGRLDALEHPRWIMQYRRNAKDRYVEKYRSLLAESLKIP